jgi:hypothetical protein
MPLRAADRRNMKSRVFKFAAFALAAVMTFQTAEVTAVAASKDSAVVTEAKAVSIKQNKNVKKLAKAGAVSANELNQQIGKNKINTLTDDTFEFMLTAKNGDIASVSLNFAGVTFKQAKRSVSFNAAEQGKAGKAVKAYYTVSGNEIKHGKKDTENKVNPFSISDNVIKDNRVFYVTKNPEFAATNYTLAKGTAKLFFTYKSGDKEKTLKVSVPVVEKAAKFKATQSKDDKKLDPSVSANSVSVNTVSENAAKLAKATIKTNVKGTYKNVPKISTLSWLKADKKVKVADKNKEALKDAVDVFVKVGDEYKQIDETTLNVTDLNAEELTVYVAPQKALKEKASYKVKLGVTYADQSKNKDIKTVTVTAKVVK